MPTYRVTDSMSGKTYDLTGDSPPTEQELADIFTPATMSTLSTSSPTAQVAPPEVQRAERPAPAWAARYPNLYGVAGAARETLGPIVKGLGLVGGGLIGAGGGIPTGPGAMATGFAGAGLGYAAAENLVESADVALGNVPAKTVKEQIHELPGEINEGLMQDLGGQVGTKAISSGLSYIGKKLVKPAVTQTLGATTGAGPGAAEEALKGSKPFLEAMRGKTTGDEIVDNVRGALNTLKDQRATAYRGQLEKIGEITENYSGMPIKNKLTELLYQYGVRSGKKGLDFSRSSIGTQAQKDIAEITDLVQKWGTKKNDNTPVMLDTLKRRLDDFYSDSSQARAFVTGLRNEVKNVLVKNVPEYAEMTKGYSEATRLIKDIESGLMLRKQGMTGRVTADNTLRRLTSAMRENFEMRRELLDVLGKEAGEDLSAQVAGYSMSPIVPRGLVGKAFGGGAGVLAYLNPKLYPLLAASSPRAMGEFLSTYGRIGKQIGKFKPAATYAAGAMAGKSLAENPPSLVSSAEASDRYSPIVNRGRQIEDAIGEPQNALASRAIDRVPQESSPAPMSANELARYDAETARMKAEQEAGKNALARKPKIDANKIESFTKNTRDGEMLMYRTKKGIKPYQEWSYDPSE